MNKEEHNKLKQDILDAVSKVIDEKFELIDLSEEEPKFKVGDWVIGKKGYYSPSEPKRILTIPTHRAGVGYSDNYTTKIDNEVDFKWIRHATFKEIKDYLIEEAKRRGFTAETKFNSLDGNEVSLRGTQFLYHKDEDMLCATNGMMDIIYKQGKWAEIIKEPKLRTPNGIRFQNYIGNKGIINGNKVLRWTNSGWVVVLDQGEDILEHLPLQPTTFGELENGDIFYWGEEVDDDIEYYCIKVSDYRCVAWIDYDGEMGFYSCEEDQAIFKVIFD